MDIIEAMLARRSVRRFSDAGVTDAQLDTLLKSAMAAPSACNARPWEFYVVRSDAKRAELRTATGYTDYDSPLIIVVAGNMRHALPGKAAEFWVQDCSAAIENILLSAAGLGLGTCWCGLYPKKEAADRVRGMLGLGEEIVPLGLIHVGCPFKTPEPRTQYDAACVHMYD